MITREDWLRQGMEMLYDRAFKPAALTWDITTVRVTCSWPGGGSARKRIGECWSRNHSADKLSEIFISPRIATGVEALDVLAHEMVHSWDDCKNGHKGPFASACKAVGLTKGKPTHASAEGELLVIIKGICEDLGPYPHSRIDLSGRKKKATYLLKCVCTEEDCGANWRMTQSWIDRAALEGLRCPVCGADATYEPGEE